MPQDIRSFFTVISKKPGTNSVNSTASKKRSIPLDSSDEDFVAETPEKITKAHKPQKKRKVISDSDSEEECSSKTKLKEKPSKSKESPSSKISPSSKGSPSSKRRSNSKESANSKGSPNSKGSTKSKERSKSKDKKEETFKPVSVLDAFGAAPVKQSKVETIIKSPKVEEVKKNTNKSSKKNKKKENTITELGIHDDEDFEKTLLELDEDLLMESVDILDKTVDEALAAKETIKGVKVEVKNEETHNKSSEYTAEKNKSKENKTEEIKNKQNNTEETKNKENNTEKIKNKENKTEDIKSKEIKNKENKIEEKKSKENKIYTQSNKLNKSTAKEEQKKEDDLDSTMDPDQERYERKRHSAILYQKFLHRGGPEHHGTKELPKGTSTCLKNLCFIRTGVLDSLENHEFENLIKEHGGRSVSSVSKKVNYVVVGKEPGPAKLEKAESLGIKQIDEDGLLDLILVKSGMKPKYSKKEEEDHESNVPKEKAKHSKSDTKSPNEDARSPKQDTKRFKKDDHKSEKETPKEEKSKPNLKQLSNSKLETNGKESKSIEIKEEKAKDISSETNKTKDEIPSSTIKKETFYGSSKTTSSHSKSSTSSSKSSSIQSPSSKSSISKRSSHKSSSDKTSKTATSKTEHSKIVHSQDLPPIEKPSHEPDTKNQAWTEKYKPKDIKAIIGQQGDSSNMKKLITWLKNWYSNHSGKNKPNLTRPSPWAKSDDGGYYKCALLSGPPGVGKTTTATLVAKELGFDVVEFNASDTRSKKLLHEEVSQLLSTTSLAGFFTNGSAPSKKHVLLMDEVDGMAGNEDRGGMQELINLIKNSNVPIICMCNDRNHQKVRSLANYCFDLRFARPRLEQIRGAMMSVCFKEGIKIAPDALSQVITGAGMDVRQVLNHLSVWTATEKTLTAETAQKEANAAKKDTILGPWEVCRKVFSQDDHKNMSVADKSRLFFYDYSLAPLFVQENYLQVVPHCPKNEVLDRLALTADSLSLSDVVDKKIRSSNNWSLLESQAMFASVLPGYYMEGHVGGQINFPGWLGKNSKRGKFQRLLSELQAHMRTKISGSKQAVNLDYIYHIRNKIIKPLEKEGVAGVDEAVGVMKEYNLTREDFDSLIELTQWPNQKDPMRMVDSKVKSAFTRSYNKAVVLPFAISVAPIKKKVATNQEENYGDEEEEAGSDEEDPDNINNDGMIKEKKKAAPKGTKKDTSGASTSKKGAASGRARKKTK